MGRSTRLGGRCDIEILATTLAGRKSPAELLEQARRLRKNRRRTNRRLKATIRAILIQAERGHSARQQVVSTEASC